MQKIKLTQGKYAIVDDEDFEYLNQWNWYFGGNGYAVRREWIKETKKYKFVRMHRLILNIKDRSLADHINLNRLDNRRSNLRVCNNKENQMNIGLKSNNTSGYKGVYWNKNRKKWHAHIKFNKHLSLGYYSNILDAAQAYNEAAIKYFGNFANINSI